jgi:hypothetical protein
MIMSNSFQPQPDKNSARYSDLATAPPVSSVEETLRQRGERYGDFTNHALVAQELQDSMRSVGRGWSCLTPVKKQALTVIADKIARILTGDPEYRDNWHDIQGYAKLAEDRCPDNK